MLRAERAENYSVPPIVRPNRKWRKRCRK